MIRKYENRIEKGFQILTLILFEPQKCLSNNNLLQSFVTLKTKVKTEEINYVERKLRGK